MMGNKKQPSKFKNLLPQLLKICINLDGLFSGFLVG
jgi:hypothetical protein